MDETFELILLAKNGDKNAKERLVKENVGLIWSIVRRFGNRGYELDDLFQIGSIGLLKCIDKFDMSYNVKFSTYAVPMITGEIKRFLRDDGMIKISRSLKETACKVKVEREKFLKEFNREATISEISERLDITDEEILVALEANLEVESLYKTIYESDGNDIYLIDKLNSKKDEQSELIDKIVLDEEINKLNEKEKEIIKLRYYEDKTQVEIAKILQISQVQVSRLEKKILTKMRNNLELNKKDNFA